MILLSHLHSVYDTDKHFIIDPITRNIFTESDKLVLTRYDHNSERFTFEIPRYVEGHDMFECNQIEIHADNISKNKSECNSDVYTVDDKQLSPDDENIVIFSWLISRAFTQIVGKLNFSIDFACIAEDGVEEYSWGTNDFEKVKINDRTHNTQKVMEEHSDFVGHMEQIAEDALEKIAKYDENIGKIVETVNTADSYIGDYQYKELICELTEDDIASTTPVFETESVVFSDELSDDTANKYWGYRTDKLLTQNNLYGISINGEEPKTLMADTTSSIYAYKIAETDTYFLYHLDLRAWVVPKELFDIPPTVYLVEKEIPDTTLINFSDSDIDRLLDISDGLNFDVEVIMQSPDLEAGYLIMNLKNPDRSGLTKNLPISMTDGTIKKTDTLSVRTISFNPLTGTENGLLASIYKNLTIYDGNNVQVTVTEGQHTLQISVVGTTIYYLNSIRFYKLHKNLGDRISEILDEINGEVI